jgi:hypothetical protein
MISFVRRIVLTGNECIYALFPPSSMPGPEFMPLFKWLP